MIYIHNATALSPPLLCSYLSDNLSLILLFKEKKKKLPSDDFTIFCNPTVPLKN